MPISKTLSRSEIAGAAAMEVFVETGRSYCWCDCGLSTKQRFCDGSHKGTAFSPLEYTAPKQGRSDFVLRAESASSLLR